MKRDKNKNKTGVKYSDTALLGYFLKGSAAFFVAAVFSSVVITVISAITPQLMGFTVDSVVGDVEPTGMYKTIAYICGGLDNVKQNIWLPAVLCVALAAVGFAFHYARMYLTTVGNQILMRRMRNTLFCHIQRLPLEFLNKHNTGDIIQRCTSDADTISNFIANQLLSLFRIALLLIVSIVFMFLTDIKLAAIASAFLPLLIGYSFLFYFKAAKHFKKCDEQEGVLSTIAQENLTGARVVRAFGKEKYERDKFEKQNSYYTGLWVKLERVMALYWTSSDFLAALQLMFIIVVGTVFCVHGQMTAGSLVAFVSYNTMMLGPVRQLGRIVSGMSKAGVSLARIGEIVNAKEELYGEYEGKISGDVVFDNVSFEYEAGKPVLDGVSFTLPEGGTLGIIGSTGSGKSTIGYLLDGLYAPTGGRIAIGGRDITDIPPATLRRNVGFVLQEGYIYSRSIAGNIGIAADEPTMENIERAADVACLSDNIEGFTDGFDTEVGERGVTLSGGQKQRVAIARTVMRGVPYIILDDALSAVDAETDAEIRAKLKTEFANATTVIISHRITTVMHCDRIIVLDGGRVAESGTHAELIEKDGIYKSIYELQTALPDDLKNEAAGGARGKRRATDVG